MTRGAKDAWHSRAAAIREVLLDWNPIGAPGLPRDEYDCCIGELLGLVDRGASELDLARFLERHLVDHFGLSAQSNAISCETFALLTRVYQDWAGQALA